MSEHDQDLGETDSEEIFDFPPVERKIFTQPYDLSLQTLNDQWDNKDLIIPSIQREYVWDNGRASRLIESLILNIPVPPIYFAERQNSVFEVVDGHQRVASIVRYLGNEFALTGLDILSEYTRNRFHQLPDREQRYLKSRTLRAIVIGRQSHPNMKFEVFERLNTGGIALNAQELRNSLYRGSFNDTLRSLARKCEPFRAVIGGTRPRRRMVDEELILRWMAFRDEFATYRPPLKRFLNEYMDANKDRGQAWLTTRADHFTRTMNMLHQVLSDQAFRLIDDNGEPLLDEKGNRLPRGVNRALFDAQAIALAWSPVESVDKRDAKRIVREVAQTLKQADLQDAVRRATGDRARIRLRVRRMVEAFRAGGLEIKVPSDVSLKADVHVA